MGNSFKRKFQKIPFKNFGFEQDLSNWFDTETSLQVMLKMKSRHVAGTITKKKKSEWFNLMNMNQGVLTLWNSIINSQNDLNDWCWLKRRCGGGRVQGHGCMARETLVRWRRRASILWIENSNERDYRVRVQESARTWYLDWWDFQASLHCLPEEEGRWALQDQDNCLGFSYFIEPMSC